MCVSFSAILSDETKVDAPRFELDECRDPVEREFIATLHARAEVGDWYADSWLAKGKVTLTVDVVDFEENVVLQVLRVDFDGSTLLYGPDETKQLATELDPTRRDVVVVTGKRPSEMASVAADWLEREMRRPVVRQEWYRRGFSHRIWQFADTGEELVWSDSQNLDRPDRGTPNRVVAVKSGPYGP